MGCFSCFGRRTGERGKKKHHLSTTVGLIAQQPTADCKPTASSSARPGSSTTEPDSDDDEHSARSDDDSRLRLPLSVWDKDHGYLLSDLSIFKSKQTSVESTTVTKDKPHVDHDKASGNAKEEGRTYRKSCCPDPVRAPKRKLPVKSLSVERSDRKMCDEATQAMKSVSETATQCGTSEGTKDAAVQVDIYRLKTETVTEYWNDCTKIRIVEQRETVELQ